MGLIQVEEMGARSVLTPQGEWSSLSRYGYDFSLNPYQGCGMGCSYCYVMRYPFAEEHPSPWGEWVRPKMNAPFLLGKARAKVWGKRIFMSSATDPYQYVERRFRLTRRCLKILLDCNLKGLTVHTRSPLVLDDLDLLLQFAGRLEVGFTIPTDDDDERKRVEPKAPRIPVRVETVGRLREAGVRVHASVSPLLRCNPERFAGLLAGVVDWAWIDRVRYEEQTGIRHMREDRSYFRSPAYQRLGTEVEACFRERGLFRE